MHVLQKARDCCPLAKQQALVVHDNKAAECCAVCMASIGPNHQGACPHQEVHEAAVCILDAALHRAGIGRSARKCVPATQQRRQQHAARKQLLQFFEAWGIMDPSTVAARRKLSAVWF